jgi:hypothetical protein
MTNNNFSQEINVFLQEKFPDKDIYNMTLEELEDFKKEVIETRQEYFMLEMAMKTLGNAAYGASANRFFYFYNVALAGDITGECRLLTKTMNEHLENWFHEEIWERKDLWERFDFALDESKHNWYRGRHVWIYSDTDSSYVTYGDFFKCFTPEYQQKYDTDEKKIQWILKYNQEFHNDLNTKWCEELYGPRHGQNVHEFELETISYSGIYLKKKKYLKGLAFSKGKFFSDPKISGTGIEIIKSTTPKLCRKILTELMRSLMLEYDPSSEESKEAYIMYFNDKLAQYRKEFYNAPVEDISQSVGVGDYKKFVLNDTDQLILEKGCPVSVQSIARFNFLAHQNGEDNKKQYSGKIKYYNIQIGTKSHQQTGYFGFPAGELPAWAPNMDKMVQWEKTIIKPINSFLEVMQLPQVNATNAVQMTLF